MLLPSFSMPSNSKRNMSFPSIPTFLPPVPLRISSIHRPQFSSPRPSHLCMCHDAGPSAETLSTFNPFPPSPTRSSNTIDAELVQSAITLASQWASPSPHLGLPARLASNPQDVSFVIKFTDWVMRPENPLIAARFLRHILVEHNNPQFLPPYDRVLLHIARLFSIILPHPVIFAARWRMRAVVAPFVGALETLRLQGSTLRNVNLLGEAVLGEEEATRRRDATIQLLSKQHIAYVSVKVSSVTSQLNIWDFDGSLERVVTALRPVFAKAAQTHPNVLVNLDMEEYRDLELTLVAFMRILEEPQFVHLDAGIVLQTYLPDALPALQRLVAWAHSRPGKGQIKIRLVKGANLAMERVDAILHGWQQAPFTKKSDTDSNYIRCLHWVLTEQRTRRVRIGVASHNLFLLAYAKKLAESRNVTHRVGFEMLQGMTPAHTPLLSKQGHGMLLYTPVCRIQDFDVAISYLFRRFEETSAAGNFLSSLHLLSDSSPAFMREEQRFRKAVAGRNSVSVGPRRRQLRPATAAKARYSDGKFINEPDTDGTLPGNRAWAMQVIQHERFTPVKNEWKVESVSCMDEILERGRDAVREWADGRGTKEREMVFKKIADNLARRRGELINALIHEGSKTFAEADSEVSEVIDFAIYYGHFGGQLRGDFEEFGVVVIAAPWNFPVAIAGGGVFAALAAGNCAILKPSSLTARCGEIVAECVWEAGVSDSVLQFVRVGDYDVGKRLIIGGDAVILTGSSETARMFKSWKCDMRLFAETSGKNSMIISDACDMDLAIGDLLHSAFSHSGQKCSASSLAICTEKTYNSDRFRRQLKDGVTSLKAGKAHDISTQMAPLIRRASGKLLRALTVLDDGEWWLVKPQCLDADSTGRHWTGGVRMGVRRGSWFHRTEVFGPVLGVMCADGLAEGMEMQNDTAFGLTGGLHSLDEAEIKAWLSGVHVGNAYVNRGTTGAVVGRQCFGGWKTSVVGPGGKAGGPNYVGQLGVVRDGKRRDEKWVEEARRSDERWVRETKGDGLGVEICGLEVEWNLLRYCGVRVGVRVGEGANEFEMQRVREGIDRCGGVLVTWSDCRNEEVGMFVQRIRDLKIDRVRVLGRSEIEVLKIGAQQGFDVTTCGVVAEGEVELLHYVREQSISWTRHRFGNMALE